MNWQAAEDGLKGLVSALTGVPLPLIAWDKQPVGQRGYPQFDLRFFDHRAREGATPEIIYPSPDLDGQIHPIAEAQRACSWSITCTNRDQRANAKAYVALDALAVMFELPYAEAKLEALGLTIIDRGRVIPNFDLPDAHRDLSMATLTLQLGYALSVTVPPGVPDSGTDIIEHTEVGGTVIDVDQPIVIPPEITPPL